MASSHCSHCSLDRPNKLDFEELAKNIEPVPDTQLWKKAIDRVGCHALYYQLDLRSPIPRIKRAIRISCNKSGSKVASLIPTVFLGERMLGLTYVQWVIGKREIASWNDLGVLLEKVFAIGGVWLVCLLK